MQGGSRRRPARQHERAQRVELGVERVDVALEPLDLARRDAQARVRFSRRRRRAEIGAEIEEIVLSPRQRLFDWGKRRLAARADREAREADDAIGLVDFAESLDPRVVLGAARTIAKAGRAVIAGACVDAVEPDHRRAPSVVHAGEQHDDDNRDRDHLQPDPPAHQPLRTVARAQARQIDEPEQQGGEDGENGDRHEGAGQGRHDGSDRRTAFIGRAGFAANRRASLAPQQAFEVVALFAGAVGIGETPAQLFEHAPRALGDVGAAVQSAAEGRAAIASVAPERIAPELVAAAFSLTLTRPSADRRIAATALAAAGAALGLLLEALRALLERLQSAPLRLDGAALAGTAQFVDPVAVAIATALTLALRIAVLALRIALAWPSPWP